MKEVTIDDLKIASKLWVEKQEKLWSDTGYDGNGNKISESELCYISSDLVLKNLWYRWYKYFEAKSEPEYRKIEEEIKKNGWNNKYPAKIVFTNKGGIFFHDGSHRINMCIDFKSPIIIPVYMNYVSNISASRTWSKWEERSKHVFPHGYLPKWEWECK